MKTFDPHRDLTEAERAALGPREVAALRAEAERMRLDAVRARGAVPEGCGPAIPEAPARGPVRVFTPMALYPARDGGWEAKPSGFAGRRGLARADLFDVMAAQAARAGRTMPIGPGQVAMARHYRDLVEWRAAGLMRGSRFDDARGSGQNDAMDAFMAAGEEVARLQQRIGAGVALPLRRVRPSERGARREITARALVDAVCIEGQPVKAVLRAHGWGWDARLGQKLLAELGAALDRMMGPAPRPGLRAVHFDRPGAAGPEGAR